MADIISEYEDKLPSKIIEEAKNGVPKGISDTKLRKIMEAVYDEYTNARVHPGEAVGLISAESIGEPGTQMSLAYDERVIVKNQNKTKIIKIGEFIDKVMNKKFNYMKQKESEICNVENADLYVPALSQNEKMEWKKVAALSRHKSPDKLLSIHTRSGRKIIATPYHSFVIRKNNKIIPVAGSDLKKGDRIPAAKHIPNLTSNVFIKLEDYLPKTEYIYESELRKAIDKKDDFVLPIKSYEQINNYAQSRNKMQITQNCVYTYQIHSKAHIPEVLELNSSFGFLVGAYLAEGTHTENHISTANISEEFLRRVIKFAERYNIGYKIRYDIGEYGKSTSLVLNSTLIADLLKKTCGKGAYNKYVPDFAFSAKPEFISSLLAAYFSGDGNINADRKVIRASSCSKSLIDGIALLLSHFGIFATKSVANKNQFALFVSHRYCNVFREKINLAVPKKKSALEAMAKIPATKTNYDLIDMLAGYENVLLILGKKLNVPSRLLNKFTNKQKIGRETLRKYIDLFEKIAEQKNITLDEDIKALKVMVNSDVVWDEIIKMDYVQSDNEYVYDFSVEDLETFTTFDGIVTHNTLNTFHFAGVAEMNVTLGLPRIIEILDGRKELENPMMEIHLKKPFASGKNVEDLRHLALQIRETKLEDIAIEFSINIADLTVEIKLDRNKMKELDLTVGKVSDSISKQLKGYNIKDDKDLIILKARSKEATFNEVYKTKEKVKEMVVKGVKGIKQVLPVKREEEFIIITSGSNLADVLQLEEVDVYRTTTNNIAEIEQVLGIEAARQAIVNEISKVIEDQGLNVDSRHIMLVSDTMCVSGSVKGITRYGVVSEKSSVLARASFETPIKHIINAALVGEVDNLDSVVENVMINQAVPIGTGLPSLAVKQPQKTAKEK